ncbi:MAG TPA: histidinol-phosphate transaminase [Vicinamibacteria bacterium]|nr:histidinol-phosphate transaminase [Vicinamibacteria bacterium]
MTDRKDLLSLVRPVVRELVAYHLDRHDVPVKLDQNENAYGLPEPVRAELEQKLRHLPLHRYPTPGQPELREALSEATGWPKEGILVGNGSDELLHTLAHTLLEPGRTAVAPTPSFFVYAYTARLAGARVLEVPMTAELRYDVPALLSAIETHSPHVTYICSPNNPTGIAIGRDALEEILRTTPGVVALDEAYWEFADWTARELLDDHPNLILMRTFSKALALAGARVGYLLAAPELTREVIKVQQPYPLNRFSIEAASVVLRHRDVAREQARRIVAERDRLLGELRRVDGVEVFASRTNFFLFRTRLGAKRTFDALLAKGVLVRDLSAHPLLPEMLRVAVGTREENERFADALVEMLKSNGTSRRGE